MTVENTSKKSPSAGMGCLIALGVLVVIGLLIWGGIAVFAGGGSSFKASIESVVPVTSNQVSVALHVTNSGSASGEPTCALDLYTSGNTDVGSTTFTLKSVKAGSTATTAVTVDVSASRESEIDQKSSIITCG